MTATDFHALRMAYGIRTVPCNQIPQKNNQKKKLILKDIKYTAARQWICENATRMKSTQIEQLR